MSAQDDSDLESKIAAHALVVASLVTKTDDPPEWTTDVLVKALCEEYKRGQRHALRDAADAWDLKHARWWHGRRKSQVSLWLRRQVTRD